MPENASRYVRPAGFIFLQGIGFMVLLLRMEVKFIWTCPRKLPAADANKLNHLITLNYPPEERARARQDALGPMTDIQLSDSDSCEILELDAKKVTS